MDGMKKIVTFLMAGLVTLSLAACGNTAEQRTDAAAGESDAEETAETAGESEQEAEKSDEELIAETLQVLVGEWYCPAVDMEHLLFNEDGTGHYTGIDKDHAFTYSTGIERLDISNNGRDIEDLMTIHYDTGETEEIRFLIGDEGITGYPGQTKLLLQTMDHGGYSGVMNYLDIWVKKDE